MTPRWPLDLLPIDGSDPVHHALGPFLAVVCAISLLFCGIFAWIREQKRLERGKADRDRRWAEQRRFQDAAHQVNLAFIRAAGDLRSEVPLRPKTMQEVLDSLPELVWGRYLLAEAAMTIETHSREFRVYEGHLMTSETYQRQLEDRGKQEKEENERWEANELRRTEYLDGGGRS